MTDLSPREIATWHREVCKVTDWLVISGDLPPSKADAKLKLDEWIAAGVTDIVDVRGEWSDEELVKDLAPSVRYHYLGTHDDGTSQDKQWFDDGIAALHDALEHDDAVVMVHCHMGVNRGPSMALAFLIDQGWDPIEALDAIRNARPIAGIIYARDAVEASAATLTAKGHNIEDLHKRIERWFERNHIDVGTIIRWIRRSE